MYNVIVHFTLATSDDPPPAKERALLNPRLSLYREYLQSRYRTQTTASSTQWPPIPTTKVFKLAMIQKDNIQRGQIDDNFVQLTITGKVDDILKLKTPIEIESIFSEIEEGRRFVLIEGAPGSGKSTLALHICQEWAEGRLFQEYDIVVLVRLRDPLVRKAKSIEYLLPCRNSTMAHDVGVDLVATDGKGVLWVLDGWDELPYDLSPDFVIYKLIRPGMSLESPLHQSSVILTSRPSSSADLHPLVSSRVEVLGFTPDELEQYFSECLKGDSTAVQTLLERIRENPVIEGSCYLPLNASIIASAFLSGDNSLPTSNHEIFTSVVQCSLLRYLHERKGHTRIQSCSIKEPESLPVEIQAPFITMCALAYSGIKKNMVTFPESDLSALGIPKEMYEVGLLQSIPSIINNDQQIYFCFLHLSIQELLAAVHISQMPPKKQLSVFKKLIGRPRFRAVFQFYAGITKLKAKRPILSKLPQFLTPNSTSILSLFKKMIKRGNMIVLVSIFHCLYETKDPFLYAFVANLFAANGSWIRILPQVSLSPIDCFYIGYFLSVLSTSSQARYYVALSNCLMGDQGCKFFTRGFVKDMHTENKVTAQFNLYLGTSNICEGIADIGKLIELSGAIRKLDLTYNPLSHDGLKVLFEALSTNTMLEELVLRQCSLHITADNGAIFCQLLSTNTSIKLLDLSSTLVSDCQHIAEGLARNKTLKILLLKECGLTDHCIQQLSTGLNDSIEELDIDGFHNQFITLNGIENFLRHLGTPIRLSQLYISEDLANSLSTRIKEVNERRDRNGLKPISVNSKSILFSIPLWLLYLLCLPLL